MVPLTKIPSDTLFFHFRLQLFLLGSLVSDTFNKVGGGQINRGRLKFDYFALEFITPLVKEYCSFLLLSFLSNGPLVITKNLLPSHILRKFESFPVQEDWKGSLFSLTC